MAYIQYQISNFAIKYNSSENERVYCHEITTKAQIMTHCATTNDLLNKCPFATV
jgi:hypothetical protein